MTAPDANPDEARTAEMGAEESPENLPPKAWVTIGLFAVFVVGFSSCAGLFLFR